MQPIDNTYLNNEKKNNNNKGIPCTSCEKTLLHFFHTQMNIYELVKKHFSKFELILWIKSNEVYKKRKQTYHSNNYYTRDIVLVDFGQNIGNELSYEHFAVVLKNQFDKVFVVPCSTSKIKRAYHKTTGKLFDEYLIGEVSDGFTRRTAIMLREAKWISKSRILKKINNPISKTLFDELYEKIFIDLFEPRHYVIEKVKDTNDKLNDENKELRGKVRELQEKLDKSEPS